MKQAQLSVVLATFNEEQNIGPCLETVKHIADEIIIVDGSSKDKTKEIARTFGAIVIETTNQPNFHINKQKALEKASGEWILQLDADERVTPELAEEVRQVITMNDSQIDTYQSSLGQRRLFLRHQKLLEKRDGKIGTTTGSYAGFFVPRLNYFLGSYLRYGGIYPDGVIRLIKNHHAHFPAKDVHEQIVVDGRVGWLQNPLLHIDSPTFGRYWVRNSRYIDLLSHELESEHVGKNLWQLVNYCVIKPLWWFFMTLVLRKGVLDGWRGIIFSFFSALRFGRAYWRYINR